MFRPSQGVKYILLRKQKFAPIIKRMAIIIPCLTLFCAIWLLLGGYLGRVAPPLVLNDEIGELVFVEIIKIDSESIQIQVINRSDYDLVFSGGRPFTLERFGLRRWRTERLLSGIGTDDSLGALPFDSTRMLHMDTSLYRRDMRQGQLYRARIQMFQMEDANVWRHAPHDVIVEFYWP